MESLIKHSRFNTVRWPQKNFFYDFPYRNKKYFDFFTNFARKKYTFRPTKCICGADDDLIISLNDRAGVEFPTVICRNCGLIRAKEYFSDEDAADFYTNHFWKIENDLEVGQIEDPDEVFEKLRVAGMEKSKLIKQFLNTSDETPIILDVGGRIGGVLYNFQPNYRLILADYFEPYLDYAKKKNIETITGGLENIEFKPDVIILSHVIEHWTNFEREIQNLIKIQKPNRTLTYLEFPGIDSLKTGRRDGDLLGDIYFPHVHYFASYVIEDIMSRYGFEKVYLDSEIKGIFRYTGKKKTMVANNFLQVKNDLEIAEKNRFKYTALSLIRKSIPSVLLNLLRKIRKPKKTFK